MAGEAKGLGGYVDAQAGEEPERATSAEEGSSEESWVSAAWISRRVSAAAVTRSPSWRANRRACHCA